MKKTIKKNDVKLFCLYFLLLFSFFQPSYLGVLSSKFNLLYQASRIIAGIFTIGFLCRKKDFSKIFLYILIYFAILFLSTLTNDGSIQTFLQTFYEVILVCLIIDDGIRHNTKQFLNSFEFLLSILTYINLLTILLFPNGLYINATGFSENWFLGYKNAHILYILPAVLISCINSYYTKQKLSLRSIILLFTGFFSTILVENGTGTVGFLLLFLFLGFYKIWNRLRIFNILSYSIAYVGAFIGIVLLRVQEWFSFFIVDVLHKDITFTGRTRIWDKALTVIPQHKWFGHGIQSFQYNRSIFTAHNTILEITYKTGIIGLLSYILLSYQSLKELWIYRKHKIVQLIAVVMFAYFMMMLTEAYSYQYIIYLFIICYNAKYFILKGDDKNDS